MQSSIARHLSCAADGRCSNTAEAGAAEVLIDLQENYATTQKGRNLFVWRAVLMNGRRDLEIVGYYHAYEGVMQIVSGSMHAPHIHFEAPQSERVPAEVARFFEWWNGTTPGSADPCLPWNGQ